MFRQGKTSAKSHIKNLIEIAAADDTFAPEEQQLLSTIASRNGISEKQLRQIKTDPGKISFEVPQDSVEKFGQLYDLVHMMSIDKNVHTQEMKLCELFAIKFGYAKESVCELIESIHTNIEHHNGPAEAMKRIGSYLKL